MPQYPNYPSSWKPDDSAQIVDLDTAVKDGLLGGTLPSPTTTTMLTPVPSSPPTVAVDVDLRSMIEHLESLDQLDAVPSLFICPISLEPMTDPVTLCTGQTYDRHTISRWLSMGHLSCPTTMQDLWDPSLIPNSTLRHLITSWFSHRYHLSLKLQYQSSPRSRAAHLLSSLHSSKGQHSKLPLLRELRLLPPDSLLLASSSSSSSAPGAAQLLSSLLGPFTSHAVGSEVVPLLASLLSLDPGASASLSHPAKLSLVVDLLSDGSLDTRLHCVSLLDALLTSSSSSSSSSYDDDDDGEHVSRVAPSPSLLVGLVRMVKDRRNPSGVWPSLRLMRRLCREDGRVRVALVGVGAVTHLVDLLPELAAVEALEAALEVLEMVSEGSEEGKEGIRACPRGIPNVVRAIMRASEGCTRRALGVLWSVWEAESCAAAAVEAGLAARLLLVMQSGYGAALKQRAAELLKLIRSQSYSSDTRFISKCKLTRTIHG